MSILRFTDGVEIDTSGEYRTLKLRDGWYVVGHGTLQPCADQEEATRVRDELRATSENAGDHASKSPGEPSRTDSRPKYPDVHVRLSGKDGNVFSIIGRVCQALRRGGATADDVKAFTDEVTASGSYDEVLAKIMDWVDVS